MARLQLFFVVALIAIVLHVTEAEDEAFTARPGKDPRCHPPKLVHPCHSSPFHHENYTLTGWFYFHSFKSCHPMYSVGGVHHCKINEDLPRTKEECENLCAEPCKMDNGTAGICMFDEYCKKDPNAHIINTRPCKAYGISCCLPGSVAVITDQPSTTTTTTTMEPANKGVNKRHSMPFDVFMKIRRDIHVGNAPKPLGL